LTEEVLALPPPLESVPGAVRAVAQNRLEAMVSAHHSTIWRFVRRLGIPEHDVDDVVHEVILVVARKLDVIDSASERAFMMSTAYRVASDTRRARARRGEVDVDEAHEIADPVPGPDLLTDQHRARKLLDDVLEAMPIELRAVFVLYELDGFTMAEIASTLELAPGTTASRLRRARELFEAKLERVEQRLRATRGGVA
jgi:RNA polymerase sigma-70 factor (ECF subfamily)